MRLFSTLLLASCTHFLQAQQVISIGGASSGKPVTVNKGVGVGMQVPDIRFSNILNAPNKESSLAQLKGKVIILEFWATWCGPCLPAMEHLSELKEKFAGKMEVIAILHEEEDRLKRYIKRKPSLLWHIADPNASFNEYFPHRFIPHTVIIDQKGRVAAITSPGEINEDIINQLINNKKINLPEKNDGVDEGFDFTKDYFPRDPDTGYLFDVQPPIPGAFAMTRMASSPPWSGRRITILNSPAALIYRTVYNVSSVRVVYEGLNESEMKSNKQKDIFCVDVIVPKGKDSELYKYAQKELEKLDLPVKARTAKRKMMTAVLTCIDPTKLPRAKDPGKSGPITGNNFVNASNFKKKAITMDEFARSYIESFGIVGIPVVNETGASGLFDFNITLDLEDKLSFKTALADMGLKIVKEEREIDVVVLNNGQTQAR